MNFEQLKVSEIKNFLDNLDMEDENIDKILNELSLDGRVSVQKLVMQFKNRYNNLKQNQLMNEEFYNFDRKYVLNNNYVIVGCDEVGRGPLAGPIVCASVVLDLHSEDKVIKNINDSKKIKSRDFKKKLSEIIKEKARYFKIIEISNDEIDRTIHLDDAIICYFASRIVGKKILMLINNNTEQETYEINWEKYGKNINRF